MDEKIPQQPVTIQYPDNWISPVIFSSPHSGAFYPDPFVEQSPLDLLTLRQSEDFMVDTLFQAAPELGSPLLKANFPRAYCDPNREAYELDPDMFETPLPDYVATVSSRISAGIGTIPKLVSRGKFIHAKSLPFAEAEHRIETCYVPYHRALRNLIDDATDRFDGVLLIDCHSMPSTPLTGGRPSVDFVLGNRFGRSCSAAISMQIAENLKSQGYSVAFNSPYAGGYITRKYYQPARHIHTLQIEVGRHLYMDQETLSPSDNLLVLQAHITDLIKAIGGLCPFKQKLSSPGSSHIQAAE